MTNFIANTPEDFADIASELLRLAKDKKVILLHGDLAAGKTTLVKYLLNALGIDEEATSPTFSIMNEYGEDNKAYHYDIYQDGSEKFIKSNLWQNLLNDGYHFIEWSDSRIENLLLSVGIDFVRVEIEKQQNKRIVTVHE